MEVYLVGGAVRDKLLGLPVREQDWVVVGATPEQMLAQGYRPVGRDFPVFLHPHSKDEYALARTERKTGPGYKGFEFHADPEVTLVQDLQRRDLTINAMAEDADGSIIDPYHGRDDLNDGVLRHISPAFAEDPVRILRVARFAARFGKWGFKVAHGTNALMRRMVDNGEIDHLVPERVWAEFAKALATDTPARFFTVLHGCGALAVLFPEIDREYRASGAAHDRAAAPAALDALQAAAAASDDPRVRFAVLLLALGHDLALDERIAGADALCRRFRAPNDYAQPALVAIRLQRLVNSHDAEDVLSFLEAAGAFRQGERLTVLLEIYRAAGLTDPERNRWIAAVAGRCAAVSAADINDASLDGPAMGEAIRDKRLAIVEHAADSG